jgi:hypothetical protein
LPDIIAIAANQVREFCGAVGDIDGLEEFDFADSDSGGERPRSLKQQGKRRAIGSGRCYRSARFAVTANRAGSTATLCDLVIKIARLYMHKMSLAPGPQNGICRFEF